jgi:hypothetical protein
MDKPHYFEAHVTIRPVTGGLLDTFHTITKDYRFHVATFTEDSAGPDSMICTGRSKSEEDLQTRMLAVVHVLRRMGFQVTRYKMESTLLDSRLDDSISPLKHKRYGIRCTFQPPAQVIWLNDGDQDADPWEGTKEEAEALAKQRSDQAKDGWTYEATARP